MRALVYIISGMLISGWAIAYFGYSINGLIHILLFVGVFIAVLETVKAKKNNIK